ncbi:MAG: hypothetical protein GC193_00870 [Cryomorphaceae bacterium]|nr:hypothetical protein [Cryomorphaceae bacterium]
MNSRATRSIFLIAFAIISSLNLQAQTVQPQATLSTNGVLTLPTGVEASALFTFDLNHLSFDNDEQMVEFMSQFNNEFFLFRCNPAENKGIVMLRTEGREQWTREQWNAVLTDCCVQKPIVK